jgi:hypothetical protein
LINKKLSCKNLTDKNIMLGTEQPSWCDRVGQVERAGILLAGSPSTVPPNSNPEGAGYIESQYVTNFGSLLPNNISGDNYVSFVNMADPIVNWKFATA